MFEPDPEYDDLIPSPEAYQRLQAELNTGARPVKGSHLPQDRIDKSYTRKHRLAAYLAHVEFLAAVKPIPPISSQARQLYSPGWETRPIRTEGARKASARRVFLIREYLLEALGQADEPMPLIDLGVYVDRRSDGEVPYNRLTQEFLLPKILGFLEIDGLVGRCWSRYKLKKICYFLEDDFEDDVTGGDIELEIGDQFIEFKGRSNHDLVTVIDFRPHPTRPGVIVPVVEGKKLGVHYSSKDLLSRVEVDV